MSSQSGSECNPALEGGTDAKPQPGGRLALRPDWRPDWRKAENYRHLLGLDRAGWAWEWLRRNPDYKGDAQVDLAGGRGEKVPVVAVLRPPLLPEASRWALSFR